jgi:hypothetical protein
VRALDRRKEGGEAEVAGDLGDVYVRRLLRVPDRFRKREDCDVVEQEFGFRN